MTRKCHIHTLHTNLRHREVEPQSINIRKTIIVKQPVLFSLLRQNDCKTIKDTNNVQQHKEQTQNP